MPETKKVTKKVKTEVKTKVKKVAKEINELAKHGAFAILETGGKQYRVIVGEIIKVEKLKDMEYKVGDSIIFDKVLLVDNGNDLTEVGTPYLDGAKVSATLIEIGRSPKVIVIKFKQKSRYFKKNGHRQPYFKVKIEKIG